MRKGRFPAGVYYARLQTKAADGRTDVRTVTLLRRGGKFRIGKPFEKRRSCGLLRSFTVGSPAFRRALGIRFSTTSAANVSVRVLRGRKVVRRYTRTTTAGKVVKIRMPGRKLKRGQYRIVVTALSGGRRVAATLRSRRV